MNSAGTIPQISFERQHSPCDIYFLQMIYRLRTCCDFSPNCKQIKQSWLTETKTLGYFLLWGSLTKPSSLNTPTSFACKSLCLKRSDSPAPTLEPCSAISGNVFLREGRLLLIRNAEWKPIRQRVSLASASCLSELKVMLEEGGTLRCMKLQLWRYYKKRRVGMRQKQHRNCQCWAGLNSVPLLNQVFTLPDNISYSVFAFL